MQSTNTSVMAVFEAVAEAGEVSRARLSDMTGFSQVTVGKAVDLLDSCGIITQYKQASTTVGRKSAICSIVKSNGMLIFDLTDVPHARIYDTSLSVCDEYSCAELCDMAVQGFTRFGEILGGELIGIGCVVPDGGSEKYVKQITDVLGAPAELIVTSSRAYTAANAKRFEYDGAAAFVRLWDSGYIDGSLMCGSRLYNGAHGSAGDFARLIASREVIGERLRELCLILDPELIHISCESEDTCASIEACVLSCLHSLGENRLPRLIVEPMLLCHSGADGAAYMLREKYILSKLPNNT